MGGGREEFCRNKSRLFNNVICLGNLACTLCGYRLLLSRSFFLSLFCHPAFLQRHSCHKFLGSDHMKWSISPHSFGLLWLFLLPMELLPQCTVQPICQYFERFLCTSLQALSNRGVFCSTPKLIGLRTPA